MGTIVHHTIVVTGWDGDTAGEARKEAVRVFGSERVSPLIESNVNGYQSFFIAPDGSKLGWENDEAGNQRRAEYLTWLYTRANDGLAVDWVEVEYGDERGRRSKVLNDSSAEDETCRGTLNRGTNSGSVLS